MPRQTRCIDCNAEGRQTPRSAYNPGPRCDEHWREEKRRKSKAVHANMVENTYGITGEQYWAIYEAQGGRCAVCQWSSGKRKRLAVDHDHNAPCCGTQHPKEQGCSKCVRALVCGPCNKDVLGRLGIEGLENAIKVLKDKPAQKVLSKGVDTIDGLSNC